MPPRTVPQSFAAVNRSLHPIQARRAAAGASCVVQTRHVVAPACALRQCMSSGCKGDGTGGNQSRSIDSCTGGRDLRNSEGKLQIRRFATDLSGPVWKIIATHSVALVPYVRTNSSSIVGASRSGGCGSATARMGEMFHLVCRLTLGLWCTGVFVESAIAIRPSPGASSIAIRARPRRHFVQGHA